MCSLCRVVCSSTCRIHTAPGDLEEYPIVGVLGGCEPALQECVLELSIITHNVCKPLQTLFWGLMGPTHTYTRSTQWKSREIAGQYEILEGLQQPRVRFLPYNLGQENCGKCKAEDNVGIGDNIEVCSLVSLGTHMQSKSSAGMKREVIHVCRSVSTQTQLRHFNPGLDGSRRDLYSIPGTGFEEGVKF